MDVTQMVQELWDRDRIKALPVTYARGVDRRDWDLVRSCFTDDCFVEGSRAAAPIEEYLADLRPGVEQFPTTMHFMGNQLVDVAADEGQVETYAVAFHWAAAQAGADDPANLVVGVRYHDSVVRTGAGWLIARRHVDPDWRSGPYPGS
jgi:3-phenylpropionate/cinnamic acid dioxygenase small subunit